MAANRERSQEASRGRPRGVIAVEATPAEGTGVTEADLQVLRRGHGRLVRCYAALLRERPTLAGSLAFTLRLTPEGRVEATDLRPESELPGALVRCLEGVLGGLRFEPGPGTRRVEGRLRLTP
jgi:hypothetical protein